LKLENIRIKNSMQTGVFQYVHGALFYCLTSYCHWWNVLFLSLSGQMKGQKSTLKLPSVFKFKKLDKISKQSMFHLFNPH